MGNFSGYSEFRKHLWINVVMTEKHSWIVEVKMPKL